MLLFWSGALRNEFSVYRAARIAAFACVMALPMVPAHAGFFDFLFGPQPPAAPSRSAPAQPATFDPFGLNTPAPQPQIAPIDSGGPVAAYCVRTCDGRYFPIQAPTASAAQVCQSFCPASVTKVFSGSSIDNAQANDGARYGDLANAFAYRQKLVSGCTCNGRSAGGLAPVDLSLDQTLRPGDVVATTNGMVAYNGGHTSQATNFTPVTSYPGLASDVRTQLGGMKVAPVTDRPAEVTGSDGDITASIGQPSRPIN
jgi:hypothetical protein